MPIGIRGFQKGHKVFKGIEKGWFTKGQSKPKGAYAFEKEENNPMWKGGKNKDHGHYILILKPEHPFCSRHGYVLEHRIIIEAHLGRYLKSTEITHHRNEIRDDNRIENLMLFNGKSAHQRFHYNPDNVKPEEIICDGRKLTIRSRDVCGRFRQERI